MGAFVYVCVHACVRIHEGMHAVFYPSAIDKQCFCQKLKLDHVMFESNVDVGIGCLRIGSH
jgi:hypothetical protein